MGLLLDALHCRNKKRPPVWIMRQAGRYLPEYRALREKYSLKDLFESEELATKITLMPIKRYDLDAAIMFSDILIIAKALGLALDFPKGPCVTPKIENKNDIKNIVDIPCTQSLGFVNKIIKNSKKELTVPLLGFCGAPFTVASYLIGDMKKTKKWMYLDPISFHTLLDKICDKTIEYLNMQVDAGIDAAQIFDSWANVLSKEHFEKFSLYYLNKIIKGVKKIPLIVFMRGSTLVANQLATINPHAISMDWQMPIDEMRKKVPLPIALQGNLDPDFLYSSKDEIEKIVSNLLLSMKDDPGFIVNLGHGISPDVNPDHVKRFIDTVKNYDA